jgi:S-adenosylmethionine:tRNA ribosyltransferase-isomerase
MNTHIHIQDFTYNLPEGNIAVHPLTTRDKSRLLVYRKGEILHASFQSLTDFLPDNSILVFNDTKVIPARIYFQKETGAAIEIFLLSPTEPSAIMAETMRSTKRCTWQCTIGNLKRWKNDQSLLKDLHGVLLTAALVDRNKGLVEFCWNTPHSFAEVITLLGVTPLPPYIKREASRADVDRYQTIYSHYEGAVAAPTAGLHFTDQVLASLQKKGIEKDFVTLHVSAGTFQPVKTENALEHTMHQEQIVVTRKTIENLLRSDRFTIAVGTTSLRTLESLYWYGVKLLTNPGCEFVISQQDPDAGPDTLHPPREKVLQAILSYMDSQQLTYLTGNTSIFIYPGYRFKICNGLITNFHLPASTLILLVAALVGNDWKRIYDEALQHDYRFLSYGDSSLLIP